MSSSAECKFWCGHCEKGYKRKADWDKHFAVKVVKGGESGRGKLVSNPCYLRKKKILGSSLSEAISLRKSQPELSFTSVEPQSSWEKDPIVSLDEVPAEESDDLSYSSPVEALGDYSEEAELLSKPKDHTEDLKEIKESIALLTTEVGKINLKLSEKEKSASDSKKEKEKLPKNYTLPSENDYFENLEHLKSSACNSMKKVLENRLVEGVFDVETDESNNNEAEGPSHVLVCKSCKMFGKDRNLTKNLGIKI